MGRDSVFYKDGYHRSFIYSIAKRIAIYIMTVFQFQWILLFVLIFQTACSQSADKEIYRPQFANTPQQEKNSTSQSLNSVRDLGNGFTDHGVAVPFATSRGTVAADKQGNNLILTWLYDHRGTYSLLMINIDEEQSYQFTLPFSGHSYTSILSSTNYFYTHFDGHFVEFDPAKMEFSFIGKTSGGSAMSMTEDDDGIIWAVLRPNCNLVSYNPKTGNLTDYGVIHSSKARQNPRSIVADDSGWIYVTAGSPGKEQIVAFNPETGKSRTLLKDTKAKLSLSKGSNGKVLGQWGEETVAGFYRGNRVDGSIEKTKESKSYITGNQSLFHRTFPDGKRIDDWVSASSTGFLGKRNVTISNPQTGQSQKVEFDYETEGPGIMGVATSPDGIVVGGTNFPMIFFQYDPKRNKWERHGAYGQFNTLEVQGSKLYIGSYPGGDLLSWNTNQKWVPTQIGEETNPQHLTKAYPHIMRPHDLLAYPDGQTIIMAGRPKGGRTTGGLLFWDQETEEAELLKEINGLPNQSTQSLVALGGSHILGGTTTKPGDSGGVRLAKEAELYIMNIESHKVKWSGAVIPGADSYQDLYVDPNGFVFGVADFDKFFVFDPETREVIHRRNLEETFGSIIPYTQGQRSFIKSPDGEIYLLLQKGVLKINQDSYKLTLLAKSPQNITGGGAYLNGRLYFTAGGRSHIYSYTLPE